MMTDAGKQERLWEYRVWYKGGGSSGGAPLSLERALKEIRDLMEKGPAVRGEIKLYDLSDGS